MGKGYNAAIAANPYVVGSFACIGGGLFGLDISSMSGVLNNDAYLRTFHHPGSNAQGAIVASMPAGSFVGALLVSWLADRIGRKNTVITSGWIWVVGSILQCAAQNRGMLVVGRIISGLSVGLASSVVPLYQSEITPPAIRGRLVSMQQWAITWGILLQYFVQFGCSYIDGVASFRIPWGLQMIPAIILSLGMLFFPESPRWLMDKGREDEALQVLADLHGNGDKNNELVVLEYEEIRAQVYFERTEGARSYLDLIKPGVLRRVSLGCSMQMWSQLSGMNVMMYYIVYVFQGAGLTGRRANLIADSVQYVLNVALTIPAILYIDRWGRRPLLIAGSALMGFWFMLVGGLQGRFGAWGDVDGTETWVITGHDAATKGIIVCSYLCVCSFAISIGPVSWTYPAEIFPLRVRAKAVSISTATNWAFNFALAWAVPPGLSNIAYKTYFIFGAFDFAACIHFFFCFPETAGRSLEEVEEIFAQGHAFTAWKIGRDVGKKTVEDAKKQVKELELHEHIDEKVSDV
ncbi:general substrate transporter [Gloeophyllum trabeum ATCC 11539]|uniref:General substrate transporter n=1 Tax=Gloeophyllum trabeum (strain ATCC 11539 / FP-39264 / Madison 617) TaxID=670483 RepID=S7RD41_GLOTA|nr:general substrate transporter [Gloeophyllum trabeum ATCC 11539]EPQ50344.1 general substrate transporter [Gloeophyllum trabeum ATCC 11539]|eukprot:PLAT9200.1.p1 GENE.PLAT9200.1~~PLAT9200.1.p1  ORF type:complete len:530 (-),score=0.35 PLAT9200.1:123-1679(-)